MGFLQRCSQCIFETVIRLQDGLFSNFFVFNPAKKIINNRVPNKTNKWEEKIVIRNLVVFLTKTDTQFEGCESTG